MAKKNSDGSLQKKYYMTLPKETEKQALRYAFYIVHLNQFHCYTSHMALQYNIYGEKTLFVNQLARRQEVDLC